VVLGDLDRFLEDRPAVVHPLFLADSGPVACHADHVGPFVLRRRLDIRAEILHELGVHRLIVEPLLDRPGARHHGRDQIVLLEHVPIVPADEVAPDQSHFDEQLGRLLLVQPDAAQTPAADRLFDPSVLHHSSGLPPCGFG